MEAGKDVRKGILESQRDCKTADAQSGEQGCDGDSQCLKDNQESDSNDEDPNEVCEHGRRRQSISARCKQLEQSNAGSCHGKRNGEDDEDKYNGLRRSQQLGTQGNPIEGKIDSAQKEPLYRT